MLKLAVSVLALFAAGCSATPSARTPNAPKPTLGLEPHVFTARDGTRIDAELGKFQVLENRNEPASRKITIAFVRFPSTSPHPGEPIVYLAGGPGGSGISAAQGPRFSLFMKLRQVADVIALDQRGTGLSNDLPPCHPAAPPAEAPATRAIFISYYRTEIAKCFDDWKARGYDIDGYTTLESARDIEDMRRALGVRKLNLWGISYGTHLGLAMMKYYPGSVRRAVLAGIEGLDETVKMPADTDAYFARLQAVIDSEPKAKAAYPDLAALMRRVHAKLDAAPAHVTLTPKGADKPVTVTFDGFAMQLLASGSNADPASMARLPQLYLALDKGIYAPAAQIVYNQFYARPPVFQGMGEAMDIASGVSPARLAEVERQARTGVLGDALNFPMPQIADIRPALDLGERFRAPFSSSIPTLFISGTLDGRTSPRAAKEIAARFSKGQRLIVENGGHNIYEADPRIADAVLAWFRDEPVPTTIHFDPPAIR